MKKVEITLYKFSELSKDAKEKAINSLSDININYDWWEYVYEDAEQVGLKIKGFDIEQRRGCDLGMYENGFDIAVKIEKNHGKQTDTFKLAEQFLSDYDKMFEKYADANNPEWIDEEKESDFDEELTELEKLFCDELTECYLKMLREEYEYLTSEPAITEMIEANEYEFYEDGELY